MPNRFGSSPMLATHSETSRAYCLVVIDSSRATSAGEQEFAGSLAGGPEIVVDRLPGLLRQFKSDGPPGLLLPDRCSIDGIALGGNVLHLEGDDIASAQFAVDGEIEHRQIAGPSFDLQLGSDRPNMLGPEGRLRSDQLALVPWDARWHVGAGIFMVLHGHPP